MKWILVLIMIGHITTIEFDTHEACQVAGKKIIDINWEKKTSDNGFDYTEEKQYLRATCVPSEEVNSKGKPFCKAGQYVCNDNGSCGWCAGEWKGGSE